MIVRNTKFKKRKRGTKMNLFVYPTNVYPTYFFQF